VYDEQASIYLRLAVSNKRIRHTILCIQVKKSESYLKFSTFYLGKYKENYTNEQ